MSNEQNPDQPKVPVNNNIKAFGRDLRENTLYDKINELIAERACGLTINSVEGVLAWVTRDLTSNH